MVDNLIFLDAVPSLEDSRDYRYSQKKADLRESVDLREWDSPVDDQKSIGSCVGNAIANAYELMVRQLYPKKFVNLSRLFIYYNSRIFDNSYKQDVGTYIRDGMKSVAKYGVCSEALWPYNESKFSSQPTPDCYVDASARVITRYETLYTLRDLIEVLNDSRPVVIGMYVYDDFMSLGPTKPVVKVPSASDQSLGSHAVAVIGYDLDRQLFLAKNSFGKNWGDKGYFWIPFEYMRTEVFEKWCFDISSQPALNIDADIAVSKGPPKRTQIIVELGEGGYAVKQLTDGKPIVLYKN